MAVHLVTGGCGFVGSALVQRLQSDRQHVKVLDLLGPSWPHLNVEVLRGSVLDQDLLRHALKDVEVVHHLAAAVPLTRSNDSFEEVNVLGTRFVFEAAQRAGVRHFNMMSSSAVYGAVTTASCPLREDAPLRPFESYGRSKVKAEQIVWPHLGSATGMSCSIIRPRTVIGPGRMGIFDLLFHWIATNHTIYFLGQGLNRLQMIHVEDLVQAMLQTAERKSHGIFNVGTTRFLPLKESIINLCEYARSKSKIKCVPLSVAQPALFMLDKMGLSPFSAWHYKTFHRDYYFDVTKATSELGWSARYSNDDMLKETYDWYVQTRAQSTSESSIHQRPLKRGILSFFMR